MRKAQQVVKKAYENFGSINGMQGKHNFMEIYKLDNQPNEDQTAKTINANGIPLYQHAPSDTVHYNDREMSLQGDKLKTMDSEMRRAFINKKTIAYVYDDQFVIMKPRWCQFKDDQALLRNVGIRF